MHTSFRPGQVWLDTDGHPIQAHGGGVLYHQGVYYWYGENKDAPTRDGAMQDLYRVDVIGISCYSSTDLYNWKNEGLVLPAVPTDPAHDLHPGKVVERPKVIYHPSTQQYVMWMHIDTADYQYARAGVAVAAKPTGPFHYLGSFRPNGAMSRDMTLFLDEDGKAYQLFSSENNCTLHISLLTDDFTQPSGIETRILIDQSREAPAIFKLNSRYFLITSGCTGWDANPAEYAVSEHPLGKWTVMGNPCRGTEAETTFGAQSTFILPVAGKSNAFIFMADRWNKLHLQDSRYVWLPLFIEDDKIKIGWLDEWDLSVFS
jgi:hypothetical protein